MTLVAVLAAAASTGVRAQVQPKEIASPPEEETIVLTPFEVLADDARGYVATSTLGGTLIRTELRDVASAISIYTKDFLDDLGAFDNETLLSFTVNADVGGAQGTFVNLNSQGEENDSFGAGNSNTRIRGLAAADNTQNYFKTEVPWDGYNTDRIDVIRGSNSILFGLGSPAGIINASSIKAGNRNRGRLQVRTDEFGTLRGSLDVNRVLIRDQLSLRLALLNNDQKFKQDPAFKDDRRVFATATIRPGFLQTRNSSLKLEVAAENGSVASNTRRGAAPIDYISPFFAPRSEGGLEGRTVDNRLTGTQADPRMFRTDPVTGLPTTVGNPMVTNAWGNGNIVLVYNGGAQPSAIFEKAISSVNGYRFVSGTNFAINLPKAAGTSTGNIVGTINPVFLNGYGAYATLKGLPFADRYGDRALSDATYYDFFNNLMDGNSKREDREWDTLRADLTHSFFRNKLSYNLQFFQEQMDFDRYAAMGSSSQLRIDASEYLPDGSPNPNAGKAYFRESPFTGSRAYTADRDAWRGVLFFEHDFREKGKGWLGRVLGRHFVTATRSQQNVEAERRDYMSNGVGLDWVASRLATTSLTQDDQFQTQARTLNYFYVSDSLVGKTPGEDALGVRNIGPGSPPITGTYTYRYFDADYRLFTPGLSPAAADPIYTRAANNPNNYRGWVNGPITLVGAPTDSVSRDYLTRVRDFFKEEVDSKAIAWQGKFWGGALIGTYGWREDTYRSWIYTWDEGLATAADFSPARASFEFSPIEQVGEATNWSVVLHLDKLFPRLPFEASLLYGKGENTNPDPSRVGVFREPVLSAVGGTTDQSLILSTRDNKWNVRLTKYETTVANASSSSTLQSQKFLLEQAFWQMGFQGVARTLPLSEGGQELEFYGRPSATLVAREAAGTLTAAETTQLALQRTNVARNISAARAWLEFEKRFADRFPDAVAAWMPPGTFPNSIATPNLRMSYPENAVLLEDNISRGYELEVTANPTRNLRLSAAVSKTEAIRDKIPGARFEEVINFIYEEWNGLAGLVAGNASNTTNAAPSVNNTPRERFSGLWDSYQVQLQRNGQTVSELSEWNYRGVANYSFSAGRLKGLSVGGNVRWESPKVIGYGYKADERGRSVVDLSQIYENDPRKRFGFSIRYARKLSNRVSWSIQANIDNAFQSGDEVIPVSTQPDGSIRSGMISEGRTWSMTNSFDF
jgi:hypothetical protein